LEHRVHVTATTEQCYQKIKTEDVSFCIPRRGFLYVLGISCEGEDNWHAPWLFVCTGKINGRIWAILNSAVDQMAFSCWNTMHLSKFLAYDLAYLRHWLSRAMSMHVQAPGSNLLVSYV
jgi:hypothetical protein